MVVTCTSCKAKFKIADDKVPAPPGVVRVRCSKCKTIFGVSRQEAPAVAAPPRPPAPPALDDFDVAPTKTVPVPEALRAEAASPSVGEGLDLDSPPTPPAPLPRPAPAPVAAGDDDDPFAHIDIEVPAAAPKPKIPKGMQIPATGGQAARTQPDLRAATRAARAQTARAPAPAPPPSPPPAGGLGELDEFGNIHLGGSSAGQSLDVSRGLSAVSGDMLDDTPPGLMGGDEGLTPARPTPPVSDTLDFSGGEAPPPRDGGADLFGEPGPAPEGDPFAGPDAQPAAEGGLDGLGDIAPGAENRPGAGFRAEEAQAAPGVAPGAVMLGRVKKEPQAAPEPPSPPAPLSLARRIFAGVANLVTLCAVIAVAAVALASYRNGGKLDRLSPGAVMSAIKNGRFDPFRVHDVHSGIYDTAGGPLWYVTGMVENASAATAPRIRVTASVVGRAGQTVKWSTGLAGSMPTPEDLRALGGAEDLARLTETIETRATEVPKGGRAPFFVAFYDTLPNPSELGLRFAVETVGATPAEPPRAPARSPTPGPQEPAPPDAASQGPAENPAPAAAAPSAP